MQRVPNYPTFAVSYFVDGCDWWVVDATEHLVGVQNPSAGSAAVEPQPVLFAPASPARRTRLQLQDGSPCSCIEATADRCGVRVRRGNRIIVVVGAWRRSVTVSRRISAYHHCI